MNIKFGIPKAYYKKKVFMDIFHISMSHPFKESPRIGPNCSKKILFLFVSYEFLLEIWWNTQKYTWVNEQHGDKAQGVKISPDT